MRFVVVVFSTLSIASLNSDKHFKRLTNSFRAQARSQVLKFGVAKYILGGQDFCLYCIF